MPDDIVAVYDNKRRLVGHCSREHAAKDVELNRAEWTGKHGILLHYNPREQKSMRKFVLECENYTCYWCGKPGNCLGHIVPVAQGGKSNPANCFCTCNDCRVERGDMPADEFARIKGVPSPGMGRKFVSRDGLYEIKRENLGPIIPKGNVG